MANMHCLPSPAQWFQARGELHNMQDFFSLYFLCLFLSLPLPLALQSKEAKRWVQDNKEEVGE